MCGLGVAVGCRMKHAKSALEGPAESLEGLRPGKRQEHVDGWGM